MHKANRQCSQGAYSKGRANGKRAVKFNNTSLHTARLVECINAETKNEYPNKLCSVGHNRANGDKHQDSNATHRSTPR